MWEVSPGSSLREPHQVLEVEVVVELGLLFRAEHIALLPLQEFCDASLRLFRGAKPNHVARGRAAGDEFDDVVVGTGHLVSIIPFRAIGGHFSPVDVEPTLARSRDNAEPANHRSRALLRCREWLTS